MDKATFVAMAGLVRFFGTCGDDAVEGDVEETILRACGVSADLTSDWSDGMYAFQFGAYGCTHVVVAASSVEDGLEIAAALLLPGTFVEPDYENARCELAEAQGRSECDIPDEDVQDHAESDLTYTESGWLCSWEWSVCDLDGFAAALGYVFDVRRLGVAL